jgi:hypothetical protein
VLGCDIYSAKVRAILYNVPWTPLQSLSLSCLNRFALLVRRVAGGQKPIQAKDREFIYRTTYLFPAGASNFARLSTSGALSPVQLQCLSKIRLLDAAFGPRVVQRTPPHNGEGSKSDGEKVVITNISEFPTNISREDFKRTKVTFSHVYGAKFTIDVNLFYDGPTFFTSLKYPCVCVMGRA